MSGDDKRLRLLFDRSKTFDHREEFKMEFELVNN